MLLSYIKIINGSIVKSDPNSANYSIVLCYHKVNECYVFYEGGVYYQLYMALLISFLCSVQKPLGGEQGE